MAGFDPKDSTSVDVPVPDYRAALEAPLSGMKIGILKEFFGEGLAAEVEKPVREALAELVKLGAVVKEVSLPSLPLSVPTYYVVAPAECSSNLARFDGVALWPSLREPEGPSGPLRPFAGRRLRCRGEASHHDRRLCAERRLLRCLLSQGTEGARADHRGFPAGLPGRGPAAQPHGPDGGLRPGRQGLRSHHHVPERHLHHRCEPGRPAGAVDALRVRRADCRWACNSSDRISAKQSC